MHLDELSSLLRLQRRTTIDSLSRRIMRRAPIVLPDELNRRRNKSFLKFVSDEICVSSMKTTNMIQDETLNRRVCSPIFYGTDI